MRDMVHIIPLLPGEDPLDAVSRIYQFDMLTESGTWPPGNDLVDVLGVQSPSASDYSQRCRRHLRRAHRHRDRPR